MSCRRLSLILLLGSLLAAPLSAQVETDAPAREDDADETARELESLLDEMTALATKTRINHDYVPGMVTVWSGVDLEALGIRNVWEALSLFPGVQSVRDSNSSPLIQVRGINFIFNSGNIKILVDSVGLNQENAGINTAVLMMPIEEVERVEFMRGPGSAIHGDFAYLGLLNIVTRRESSGLFGRAERDGFGGGAHFSWSDPKTLQRISAGLAGASSDDADGKGPAELSEDLRFGRFFWGREGISVSLQAVDDERQGRNGPRRVDDSENRLAAEVRYARELAPALHAEVYAGLLENDDAIGTRTNDARTLQSGLDVRWRVPGRHAVFFSLGYGNTENDRVTAIRPPLFNTIITGLERSWRSAVLQDQWDVTADLTVTAGVRVDDFSDIPSLTTSRLAIVYKLDDHQILKTQYAEGFRSPWFLELYQSGEALPGLEAETIATTELSYILRWPAFVGRITLFRADLDDMIQPPPAPGLDFANASSADTSGVEIEWQQELARQTRLSANLSWIDVDDRRFTRDVQAASEWLWNLALMTTPTPWLRLGGRWNHVGDRGGFATTPTIDGYDTVDLTATVPDLFHGLTVRAGVKNVLDDDVISITTLPPPFSPILQPYGGRTWWLQVSRKF